MAPLPGFTTRVLYEGMPPTDRVFAVKVAGADREIRCGGACRDDYGRILINSDRGQIVKLQRAAWESFHDAEIHLGFQIALTGSWRSCAYQTELYRSDPNRYAPPNVTAHPRGLAIDVSQAMPAARLAATHAALIARGWHQTRADEPWHYSSGINV